MFYSPLQSGSSIDTLWVEAGEYIPKNKFVYIKDDGKIYLTLGEKESPRTIGIVREATPMGVQACIQYVGLVDDIDLSSYTTGNLMYQGSSGSCTTDDICPVLVGIVVSSTTLLLQLEGMKGVKEDDPPLLVKGCTVSRYTDTINITDNNSYTEIVSLPNIILPNIDSSNFMLKPHIRVQNLATTEGYFKVVDVPTSANMDLQTIAPGDFTIFSQNSSTLAFYGKGEQLLVDVIVECVYWIGGKAEVKRKVLDFTGTFSSLYNIFSLYNWKITNLDTPDYYMISEITITALTDLAVNIEGVHIGSNPPIVYFNDKINAGQTIKFAPTFDDWSLDVKGQYQVQIVLTYFVK